MQINSPYMRGVELRPLSRPRHNRGGVNYVVNMLSLWVIVMATPGATLWLLREDHEIAGEVPV